MELHCVIDMVAIGNGEMQRLFAVSLVTTTLYGLLEIHILEECQIGIYMRGLT